MSVHADWCEGDPDHDNECATATELARLRAFAETARDEFECTSEDDAAAAGHVDDCWHCFALQALEKPGR